MLLCVGGHTAFAQSPFCNEQFPLRLIPVHLSQDPGSCTFSLSASTHASNPSNYCSLHNPCTGQFAICMGSTCFRWVLFRNDQVVQSACTGSSSHSFTGLEELGDYKIIVEYKRFVQCPGGGICVIHTDEGTVTISSTLSCPAINTAHNSSLPFSAHSSNTMTVNCSVQNNKTTILKSEEKVVGLPGFRSGTGSETYFHVSIEGCSFKTYSSGEGTSSIQDSTGSDVIDHVHNSINGHVWQSERKGDLEDIDHSGFYRGAIIYPNPTAGLFTLQHPFTVAEVQVFDTFGRRVTEIAPNASSVTIDLNSHASGLYFIRATMQSGSTETYRVVLQSP